MALYKQAEFAEKCGISMAYLSVNKKRGKVILEESGMIDDTNQLNQLFVEKCKLRVPKAKSEGKKPKVKKEVPADEPEESVLPRKQAILGDLGEAAKKKLDLDSTKKEAEIEKIRREIEALRRKEEKNAGLLLPTDLVINMSKRIVHTYGKKFKGSLENIAAIWGKKYKLNRNDLAELRKEMLDQLNLADREAKEELHKEVENLVNEVSTSAA